MSRGQSSGRSITFADTDAGGAREQERVGKQIVSAAELLLEKLIVLRGQGSGQVLGLRRKIFVTNQVRLDGTSVSGQVLQQTAEGQRRRPVKPGVIVVPRRYRASLGQACFPPSMVRITLTSRILSGGMRKMSSDRTTISASFPGSRVPFSRSENSAYAPVEV